MKHVFTVMVSMLALLSISVFAAIPFGHQVNTVQNYNRASADIATSGLIGDGGPSVLEAHGFKTVIDMRVANEGTSTEKALIEAAGMVYVNIPMTVTNISHEHLDAFTQAIKNSPKPILVHCGSGNRAGAIWASYLISQGEDIENAIAAGRKAGMRPPLEEKVRTIFAD